MSKYHIACFLVYVYTESKLNRNGFCVLMVPFIKRFELLCAKQKGIVTYTSVLLILKPNLALFFHTLINGNEYIFITRISLVMLFLLYYILWGFVNPSLIYTVSYLGQL